MEKSIDQTLQNLVEGVTNQCTSVQDACTRMLEGFKEQDQNKNIQPIKNTVVVDGRILFKSCAIQFTKDGLTLHITGRPTIQDIKDFLKVHNRIVIKFIDGSEIANMWNYSDEELMKEKASTFGKEIVYKTNKPFCELTKYYHREHFVWSGESIGQYNLYKLIETISAFNSFIDLT